jgi:hybrid cluster-associated redox disulfide protein
MVNKDMIIKSVIDMDPGVAQVFFSHGLFCIGCPSASGESIEDACAVHGIEVDTLINDINEYFKSKNDK